MKKFIGKSAAIAAAALLFAQSVPMAEVGAEGSNNLVIHSYKLNDGDYNTAMTANAGSTGTTDDENMLTGLTSKVKNDGRTYSIYTVTGTAGSYTVSSAVAGTQSTNSGGVATFSGLDDGIYWVDPVDDDNVNHAFSKSDGFFVQLPGASNEVHVYPKNTDNTGDMHKIVFTKTGEDENTKLGGVEFKVYYKDAQDKWVAAEPATDYKTDDSGKIEINNLPLGDYYFVEQAAPDGYLLNQKPQLVTVDGNTAPAYTFKNDAELTVKTEIDNDGAGDTYNWTITADLPETPENIISYTITDSFTGLKDVDVTGIEGLDANDYNVDNTEDGKIKITLTDSGIGKIQNGNPDELVISITSTKADNLSDGSEITNSVDISYEYAYDHESGDGLPDIPDIPDPDDADFNDDEYTHDYPAPDDNDPDTGITLTVKDITISNVDSNDTAKEISGAEYEIYKADGTTKLKGSIADDSSTKIATVTGGLAPGHYKLKQTKVGENYSINTASVDFYVGTNGSIYSDAACKTLFTSGEGKGSCITIKNSKAQFALPFTGTTATRVFTIVGICVMLAAGTFIFIILKKKDEDEDDNKA